MSSSTSTVVRSWPSMRDQFINMFNSEACQTMVPVSYWSDLFASFITAANSAGITLNNNNSNSSSSSSSSNNNRCSVLFTDELQQITFTNILVRTVKEYTASIAAEYTTSNAFDGHRNVLAGVRDGVNRERSVGGTDALDDDTSMTQSTTTTTNASAHSSTTSSSRHNHLIIISGSLSCLALLSSQLSSELLLAFLSSYSHHDLGLSLFLLLEHEYRYHWIEYSGTNNNFFMRVRVRPNADRVTTQTKLELLASNNCHWIDLDIASQVSDHGDQINDSDIITTISSFFEIPPESITIVNKDTKLQFTISIKFKRSEIQPDTIYRYKPIRHIVERLKRGYEPPLPFLSTLKKYIVKDQPYATANSLNSNREQETTGVVTIEEDHLDPVHMMRENALKIMYNCVVCIKRATSLPSRYNANEYLDKVFDEETITRLLEFITLPLDEISRKISTARLNTMALSCRLLLVGLSTRHRVNIVNKLYSRIRNSDDKLHIVIRDLFTCGLLARESVESILSNIFKIIRIGCETMQNREQTEKGEMNIELQQILNSLIRCNTSDTALVTFANKQFLMLFKLLPQFTQIQLLLNTQDQSATTEYLEYFYRMLYLFSVSMDRDQIQLALSLLSQLVTDQTDFSELQKQLKSKLSQDLIANSEQAVFDNVTGQTLKEKLLIMRDSASAFIDLINSTDENQGSCIIC